MKRVVKTFMRAMWGSKKRRRRRYCPPIRTKCLENNARFVVDLMPLITTRLWRKAMIERYQGNRDMNPYEETLPKSKRRLRLLEKIPDATESLSIHVGSRMALHHERQIHPGGKTIILCNVSSAILEM
jgi:hypothetical protein